MGTVKILRLMLLYLQSILVIHGELITYQLRPQYWIPRDNVTVAEWYSFQNHDSCVKSINYAKDGNKTYLGWMLTNHKAEFLYSVLFERYTQDDRCRMDRAPAFETRKMIFMAEDQFMILIKGCFIINDRQYKGMFVLMEDNWKKSFVNDGIASFNIAHTFNEFNQLSNQSEILENCWPLECLTFGEYCQNNDNDSDMNQHQEIEVANMETICIIIVSIIILTVAGILCNILYRININSDLVLN